MLHSPFFPLRPRAALPVAVLLLSLLASLAGCEKPYIVEPYDEMNAKLATEAETLRDLKFKYRTKLTELNYDGLNDYLYGPATDPGTQPDPDEAFRQLELGWFRSDLSRYLWYEAGFLNRTETFRAPPVRSEPPDPNDPEVVRQSRTVAAIAGLYSSTRKEILVITDYTRPNKNSILVHEMTHALQDQHFSLKQVRDLLRGTIDGELTSTTIIEGDATFSQVLHQQYEAENRPPPLCNVPLGGTCMTNESGDLSKCCGASRICAPKDGTASTPDETEPGLCCEDRAGAPCDAALGEAGGCCDGLSCQNGRCTEKGAEPAAACERVEGGTTPEQLCCAAEEYAVCVEASAKVPGATTGTCCAGYTCRESYCRKDLPPPVDITTWYDVLKANPDLDIRSTRQVNSIATYDAMRLAPINAYTLVYPYALGLNLTFDRWNPTRDHKQVNQLFANPPRRQRDVMFEQRDGAFPAIPSMGPGYTALGYTQQYANRMGTYLLHALCMRNPADTTPADFEFDLFEGWINRSAFDANDLEKLRDASQTPANLSISWQFVAFDDAGASALLKKLSTSLPVVFAERGVPEVSNDIAANGDVLGGFDEATLITFSGRPAGDTFNPALPQSELLPTIIGRKGRRVVMLMHAPRPILSTLKKVALGEPVTLSAALSIDRGASAVGALDGNATARVAPPGAGLLPERFVTHALWEGTHRRLHGHGADSSPDDGDDDDEGLGAGTLPWWLIEDDPQLGRYLINRAKQPRWR
jgi:hypothetical protein